MVRSNTCEAKDIETVICEGKKTSFQNYSGMCLEKHSQFTLKFVSSKQTSFTRFMQSMHFEYFRLYNSGLSVVTNFQNLQGCDVPTWGCSLAVCWPRVVNYNC